MWGRLARDTHGISNFVRKTDIQWSRLEKSVVAQCKTLAVKALIAECEQNKFSRFELKNLDKDALVKIVVGFRMSVKREQEQQEEEKWNDQMAALLRSTTDTGDFGVIDEALSSAGAAGPSLGSVGSLVSVPVASKHEEPLKSLCIAADAQQRLAHIFFGNNKEQ